MVFGPCCNYADIVTEDFVKSTCPDEFMKFMDYVDESDANMKEVAWGLDDLQGIDEIECVEEDVEQEIRSLFELLRKEFDRKTELGLSIRFCDENGDESGIHLWEVTNIRQLTPAAKEHEEHIERKHWITYG